MRKGSLEYWPHRRAKKQMPRVRTYVKQKETGFLGLIAFKAGMTHMLMIDDSESPAKGTEVSRAVTVLEIPKIHVYGIRAYKKGYIYKEIAKEVYDSKLAANVGIKSTKNTDVSKLKSLTELTDATALAYLDAGSLNFGNKRVMRFEIPIGGEDVSSKISFIEGFLGKEVKINNFIKTGEYLDITSISKGKGWTGVIKRFGVSRQYRKATGKVRHVGTLGAWHPPKVLFTVPHSGHKGYNYRTELNKRVLKIGNEKDINSINIKGGFTNYGNIKNEFIVIDGSIPGSAKRLIRLRKAIRNKVKVKEPQIVYTSLESKQ
ncbi:MAG: 50S ribosomal protein L3 [Candidatus Micrarchaeaceae archaeon]